jgi:hypothetical protein
MQKKEKTMKQKKTDIHTTLDLLFKADRAKLLDTLLGFALMVGFKVEGRFPSLKEWWNFLQMVETAHDEALSFSAGTPEQALSSMEIASKPQYQKREA